MQERRTLVYIDKDSIPSSAVEAADEITGNVLYIPYSFGTKYNSGEIWSSNGIAHCNIGLNTPQYDSSNAYGKYPINLLAIGNGSSEAVPILSKYLNYSYCGTLFPMVIMNSSSSGTVYENVEITDLVGKYVKLIFDNPVYFLKYSQDGPYPVYIDTEE